MGRLRRNNETKTSLIVLALIAISVFLIFIRFWNYTCVNIPHPGSFEVGIVLLSIIALFILLLIGRCCKCD